MRARTHMKAPRWGPGRVGGRCRQDVQDNHHPAFFHANRGPGWAVGRGWPRRRIEMDKTTVRLLSEIGGMPGSYVGDKCQYASIPSWMKHRGSDSIHFKSENEGHRDALNQPEFQEALNLIKRGFTLLATAKERAIERIISEERRIEHEQTVDEEVAPVQARNAELRDAVESLLGAIQGGDLESAKRKAYAALAPREDA